MEQQNKLKSWRRLLKKKGLKRKVDDMAVFPNVASMQKLLLAASRNSLGVNTSGAAKCNVVVQQVTLEDLAMERRLRKKKVDKDDNVISMRALKKPKSANKCEPVIKYWLSKLPTSALVKFCPFDTKSFQSDVLLTATLGLMVDSETKDCQWVDMKWAAFLEGAMAQSQATTQENNDIAIRSMKNLILNLSRSQDHVIQHNKILAANVAEQQTMIDQAISRISDVSAQLRLVSTDLKTSLALAEEMENQDVNSNRNNNDQHPNSSTSSIVGRRPAGDRSFYLMHEGARLTITLSPNEQGDGTHIQPPAIEPPTQPYKMDSVASVVSIGSSSDEEARQLLVRPIMGMASLMGLVHANQGDGHQSN